MMPPDRDPWKQAREMLRTAPPKVRRVLRINLAAAVFGLAVAVVDVIVDTSANEIYSLLGIALAMIGIVLMTQVYVLHHLSQHEDPECIRMSMFNLKSTRLHGVFRGVAFLGVLSALVFAVAIGVFIPVVMARPFLLLVVAVLVYYLIAALRTVRHITDFLYEHAREQADVATRAQADATDSQLRALQAQMQPHFLFNALNTVAALVRTDARQAERTIENLAQVLRRGLERSRRPTGTVGEEVEFIQAWLAVEQQRWGDRLSAHWDVAEDTRELTLAPMTLQPVVENALKHGLGTRIAGGHIEVRIVRDARRLHMTVTDDGGGIAVGAVDGTGLGNLRQRLQTRFGDAARVELNSGPHGTVVDLFLPIDEEV